MPPRKTACAHTSDIGAAEDASTGARSVGERACAQT